MNDLTLCISAFERPEALSALLTSIRAHYPTIPVLVVDSSRHPRRPSQEVAAWQRMRFDCGVSAMRNKLIRSVATPYAMMLDDDFLFSDDTRLEVLRDHLELHDELDLVAGMVLSRGGQLSHYEGLLEIEDDTLFYRHGTRGEVGGLPLYDLVYNFFVGRTARIRKVGWDNKQKLAEHSDFFLRAKGDLVVGYDETVSIGHQVAGSADYNRYRMRGTRYARQFLRKHNLARGIDFRGMVLEATE